MAAEDIDLNSLLLGVGAHTILACYALFTVVRGRSGTSVFIAALITASALAARLITENATLIMLLELLGLAAWHGVVLRALGVDLTRRTNPDFRLQFQLAYASLGLFTASVLVVATAPAVATLLGAKPGVPALACKLLMSVMGLLLVEQLFRNTRRDYLWNMKFMVLGLGVIFSYEFLTNSDAVLFGGMSATLYKIRGVVYALAVPFMVVASGRSTKAVINVNLKRDFVFKTGVLFAAGIYLLLISGAGYYLQAFGGAWGDLLQVTFVLVALALLVVLAGSSQIRSYLRVVIDRNLFEYKYDYRNEWRKITDTLTRLDTEQAIGQRVIIALADVLHCQQGAIWTREANGHLLPYEQLNVNWNFQLDDRDARSLETFFRDREWIIDFDEYRSAPATYRGLDVGSALASQHAIRFGIPLFLGNTLIGVVLLGQPSLEISLIWEDYDLLKVSARQAASTLAQHRAAQSLARAGQFEAFHRMSAFVIHDIKTVVAQLSLLVRNAERHKSNPVFVDDMVGTIQHASRRMQKLIDQLRDPQTLPKAARVNLIDVVVRAVDKHRASVPAPTLDCTETSVDVVAPENELAAIIGHIIQNAQDATPEKGEIRVRVRLDTQWVRIEVEDTGTGMDEVFVRERLFNPFDSTKGLTGMGIGVFQSRELLRSCGGDMQVTSRPGEGTTFVLILPIATAAATA